MRKDVDLVMSGPLRISAIVLGFVIPSVVVYLVLRRAWPSQHDLGDLATGLIRILLAVGAGVVGAVVVGVLTRHN